jgi:anaerobic magnesium-protoporphyrin IX monomethyl ester cyclase
LLSSAVASRERYEHRKWDYKHQVLEARYMPPWRIFLWVKFVEIVLQARPKALWRSLLQPDRAARHGMLWFTRMGRRVLIHEWWNFFFSDRRVRNGPTLEQFWGAPQDRQEIPLRIFRQRDLAKATPTVVITENPIVGTQP